MTSLNALMIKWLLGLLCLAASVHQRGVAQTSTDSRRYDAEEVNCQNVSEIVFISFFPCFRNDSTDSEFSPLERLGECDLLAEAAAYLAVDRVNEDPTILPNITLQIRPVYIPTRTDSNTELENQFSITTQLVDLLRTQDADKVWGFIGPNDNPLIASFTSPISANSGLMTVSYGTRTISDADDVPTFYRTLSSELVSNLGRSFLLVNHAWYRIAILYSSSETYYLNEYTHFTTMYNDILLNSGALSNIIQANSDVTNMITLEVTETFTDSPNSALSDIANRDINIIVGFFGPDTARKVLCTANSTGLVSSKHAWILPSYYDPNWWKLSNETEVDSVCSNSEMSDILESVIFINNVKYPPVDLPMDDFHSMLMNKTLDLFPSLTEENLKPYLLRSRATSAYDAVTLLAKSVGVAFDQGGDSCTNTSIAQVALDRIFMRCELCRLYSAFPDCVQLTDENFLKVNCSFCSELNSTGDPLSSDFYSNEYDSLLSEGLRSQQILNAYGQTLFSQFHDSEECPIMMWWPMMDYNSSFLLISDFDNSGSSSYCVAKSLNLSRSNFVSEGSGCLERFNWRGSYTAPISQLLEVSHIELEKLITVSVIVFIGLLLAAFLLIFNILWRKNSNVKATSPWLNVTLLVGVILRLPTPLYTALVHSGSHYTGLIGIDLTPLCYFELWQYYIGDALFVSALIAKNWRIYKIFFNKGLKERGNRLSDGMLMLGVLIMILPIGVILIAWSIIGYRYEGHVSQNKQSLQIINVTYCDTPNSEHLIIFDGVANAIILLFFILLFVLSLLTATVPSSTFRSQGLVSYKAALFVIIPTPIVFIGQTVAELSGVRAQYYEVLLWFGIVWTIAVPFVFMLLLFVPMLFAVIRDHFKKKRAVAEEKESRKLTKRYSDLKHEEESLKSQLAQIDSNIKKLKEVLFSDNVEHSLMTKELSATLGPLASSEKYIVKTDATLGLADVSNHLVSNNREIQENADCNEENESQTFSTDILLPEHYEDASLMTCTDRQEHSSLDRLEQTAIELAAHTGDNTKLQGSADDHLNLISKHDDTTL